MLGAWRPAGAQLLLHCFLGPLGCAPRRAQRPTTSAWASMEVNDGAARHHRCCVPWRNGCVLQQSVSRTARPKRPRRTRIGKRAPMPPAGASLVTRASVCVASWPLASVLPASAPRLDHHTSHRCDDQQREAAGDWCAEMGGRGDAIHGFLGFGPEHGCLTVRCRRARMGDSLCRADGLRSVIRPSHSQDSEPLPGASRRLHGFNRRLQPRPAARVGERGGEQ
mmetsp:Transcript_12414/g.40741  ORF Transcript_12414/g.40741 Transcript_12414/m.40741 type:complete len:223 (+) Transcript_12414:399-1067(+)